jgi:hypothetical protein
MGVVLDVQEVAIAGWALLAEGQEAAEKGSPEARCFALVPADGIPLAELKVCAPGARIAPCYTRERERERERERRLALVSHLKRAVRGEQQSVATPHAARGWAHPPCRHIEIPSCCCLGSAFEWRLSKP